MNRIIDGLKSVDGVMGAALYSSQEGVLGSNLPSLFRDELLAQMGRFLQQLSDAGQESFGKIPELFLTYVDLGMVVRRVAKQHFLVVFHEEKTNAKLLNVALNLAEDALETLIISRAFEPSAPSAAPRHPATDSTAKSSSIAEPLAAMESLLAKVLGPIAPILFKENLERWLSQGRATAARLPDLMALLEAEINDAERIEKFRLLMAPHLDTH